MFVFGWIFGDFDELIQSCAVVFYFDLAQFAISYGLDLVFQVLDSLGMYI